MGNVVADLFKQVNATVNVQIDKNLSQSVIDLAHHVDTMSTKVDSLAARIGAAMTPLMALLLVLSLLMVALFVIIAVILARIARTLKSSPCSHSYSCSVPHGYQPLVDERVADEYGTFSSPPVEAPVNGL